LPLDLFLLLDLLRGAFAHGRLRGACRARSGQPTLQLTPTLARSEPS
jgi:hypothetical protein